MLCINAVRRVMEESAPLWLKSADDAVTGYVEKHYPNDTRLDSSSTSEKPE
jgi:hypothetical protein